MAAKGKVKEVEEVFTAEKLTRKHGVESHTRPKVSPMTPSKESLDSRTASNAGVDYINDTLQASATGEVTLAPDVCMFNIMISSQKDRLQDAKNSVARRQDYILQALHNKHLKDSQIKVTDCRRRVVSGCTELFCVESHIHVRCPNSAVYAPVNSILIEKLDHHVVISAPEFTHEAHSVEQARLNASVLAVKNCKKKAVQLAQAVHARIGPVLAVREDFCHQSNDIVSATSEVSFHHSRPVSVHEKVQQATLRVTAKATVTFQLRPPKHKDH